MRSVNPHRLERFLGQKAFDELVFNMKDWYGGPVALAGVPGEVYATKDDFVGHCQAGEFASVHDRLRDLVKRLNRRIRISSNGVQFNAGFATLTALRQAGYNGPMRVLPFVFVAQATGAKPSSFWKTGGGVPISGSDASAAAAGRNPVGGTDGGHYLPNAPTGMRSFFGGGLFQPSYSALIAPGECILMYDRLFDVAKTMSSSATEAVTGTLSRYTSTTTTDPASCVGNFCFPECTASLGATNHNWTVCQYTPQSGTGTSSFASAAGFNGGVTGVIDVPNGQWFLFPAAGDTGMTALTQMQCSAVVTGTINFVVGHPIAWIPTLPTAAMHDIGGVTSAFNMTRIFDGACLSYIIPTSGGTTVNLGGMGYVNVICG
jgi:hypothetical protein